MKNTSKKNRVCRFSRCTVFRVLVTAFLIGTLGLEILPWGFVECVPAVPGGQSGRTFSIEPLQVCDHGNSFLGVLFDLPVLLPGGPCVFPSPEVTRFLPEAVVLLPDGYLPAIDHPPQIAA